MRLCTSEKKRRRKADRVFPTGIDRCLFVFAIGPDSINPARVMITVPPCRQVSERECKRGEKGQRGEEEVEEEEVWVVGTTEGKKIGGGKLGFLFFLTHTWQMSGYRVGLQECRVSAVLVSQI